MKIRFAEPGDIAEIQRIGIDADARYNATAHPECADGLTIPTEAATRAVETQRLLVVQETLGRVPIGWALIGKLDGEICLGQISVLPSHGQQGAGSLLLSKVIEIAKGQGAPSIVLNTQRDIPWCAPWYEAFGFRTIDPSDWSPALAKLARDQEDEGLDWSSRVHMRLHLDRG
jgi:predicted N-acetyltransferase YhbS